MALRCQNLEPGGIICCYRVTSWHDLALKHHLAASFGTKFNIAPSSGRFWDQLAMVFWPYTKLFIILSLLVLLDTSLAELLSLDAMRVTISVRAFAFS